MIFYEKFNYLSRILILHFQSNFIINLWAIWRIVILKILCDEMQQKSCARFTSKAEIKGFLFFLKAHFFEFLSNK